MRLRFASPMTTPQTVHQARRALRIARRYRIIQMTPTAAARARAEDALAGLHERVPAHWCVVRDAVRYGETAAEVLRMAAEDDVQLIVVGAHSRRPAVAAMVGSCADRIIREARCPVLAVPSPAPVVRLPLLQPAYA